MGNVYYYDFCIGKLGIAEQDGVIQAIFSVKYLPPNLKNLSESYTETESAAIKEAARQLNEYFEGKRRKFDFKFELSGTEFEKKVHTALINIDYGKTKTYKEIAELAGSPAAVRAAGGACGKNPLLVVVPCHRCVGKNGLCGFSAGLENKKILLDIEAKAN